MTVSLETLELSAEQLQAARDAVQQSAYYHWQDAGCPNDGQHDFWAQAEREWIERCYVPCRSFDGARPAQRNQPIAAETEQDPVEQDIVEQIGVLQSAV